MRNLKSKRMDKLEYIPGDLVSVYVGVKKYIVEVIGMENENEVLSYQIKFPNGEIQYADKDNIVPIPLTPDILEKNGWEIVSCRDGEETYKRGGTCCFTRLININSFYLDGARYNTTGQWLIKYVHELQHHLWVLKMNNNIKI